MPTRTRTAIALIGGLLLAAAPMAAASSSSTTTSTETTFCCSSYDPTAGIGYSCTVAAYSQPVVSQCKNVSFSCGSTGFECATEPAVKLVSGGYSPALETCSCFSFSD